MRRCIRSARNTVDCDLNIFVAIDDDDSYFTIPCIPLVGECEMTVLRPRHYYVRGMNALYTWMRPHIDYFVVSNDDVTFDMKGWGPYVIAKLNEHFPAGEGILELAGPELAAHYATRASFIDGAFDGLLAEPAYTFYCSDTELRNRAKALGRYVFQPAPTGESILRHHIKGDGMRSEVEYWMASDRETFKRRAKAHPEWQREVWQ